MNMKKLFLFAILMVGLGISSQAQTLNYEIITSTSASWKLKMQDAGSSSTQYELITPASPAMGVIAGFGFNLKWLASSNTGCLAYAGAVGPSGGTPVSFTDSCGNVHTYSIIENTPGDFTMKMHLN